MRRCLFSGLVNDSRSQCSAGRPASLAGRSSTVCSGICRAERDRPRADVDRTPTNVRMYHNPARHGIAQTQIVGGRHPVDQHPGLIPPRDRVDDTPVVWPRGLPREGIEARAVIEATVDAEHAGDNEPLQGLIDGFLRAKIEEIAKRPHVRRNRRDAAGDQVFQVGGCCCPRKSGQGQIAKLARMNSAGDRYRSALWGWTWL